MKWHVYSAKFTVKPKSNGMETNSRMHACMLNEWNGGQTNISPRNKKKILFQIQKHTVQVTFANSSVNITKL